MSSEISFNSHWESVTRKLSPNYLTSKMIFRFLIGTKFLFPYVDINLDFLLHSILVHNGNSTSLLFGMVREIERLTFCPVLPTVGPCWFDASGNIQKKIKVGKNSPSNNDFTIYKFTFITSYINQTLRNIKMENNLRTPTQSTSGSRKRFLSGVSALSLF